MASQVEGVKWVPGTRFLVDGFRFPSAACRHYFLTHAHSDHTTGLSPTFSAGVIYCSHVTYRLLVHDMGMPPQVLRPLDLDVPTVIDGVEVTPICANHCPGAVCFLFKIPSTRSGEPGTTAQTVPQQTVLHTGDFRWCPQRHGEHPSLAAGVDTLMLDTTYCVPKWRFPPQDEVVSAMADLMRAEADGEGEAEGSAGGPAPPTTLFLCMSYHIGKERAYLGAAHRLGWHVWVPPAKRRVLRLLDLPPEWMALLEDDPERARIHVLGGGEQLHAQAVADRLAGTAWTRAVVLRPTGWSYRASGALDRRALLRALELPRAARLRANAAPETPHSHGQRGRRRQSTGYRGQALRPDGPLAGPVPPGRVPGARQRCCWGRRRGRWGGWPFF